MRLTTIILVGLTAFSLVVAVGAAVAGNELIAVQFGVMAVVVAAITAAVFGVGRLTGRV